MSTNTTNYNLVKPTDADDADISIINANMDTIDQTLKSIEQKSEDFDKQNIKIGGEQILTGVKIFPTLISNGDSNHLQFFRNFAKEWHMEALDDKLSVVQSGVAERLSIQKDGNISINGALNVPTPVQDSHAVNKQYVDKNLSEVHTIKTAEGTPTAIILETEALSNGYIVTFIAASNNSGNVTTINGVPLYKPNTTTAPTLIAGKAYTIWYNSTTPCFFIKASAEGTAVAANVLAGTTFSNNDETGILGTMIDNKAISKTLSTSSEQYTIPAGYHNGNGKVTGASYLRTASGTFTGTGADTVTITCGFKPTTIVICKISGVVTGALGVCLISGNTSVSIKSYAQITDATITTSTTGFTATIPSYYNSGDNFAWIAKE